MPKPNEPIRLNARIDPELHREMKTKLASDGRSFQSLVDEAIAQYLRQNGESVHAGHGDTPKSPESAAIKQLRYIEVNGIKTREMAREFLEMLYSNFRAFEATTKGKHATTGTGGNEESPPKSH